MTADDFREIALSMHGAIESSHMNHPDFRANGRIFATLHSGDRLGMVKLEPDEQREVMRRHPRCSSRRLARGAVRGARTSGSMRPIAQPFARQWFSRGRPSWRGRRRRPNPRRTRDGQKRKPRRGRQRGAGAHRVDRRSRSLKNAPDGPQAGPRNRHRRCGTRRRRRIRPGRSTSAGGACAHRLQLADPPAALRSLLPLSRARRLETKKKLRLDTPEGAVKDIGDGWWIIKPGDPSSSELIRRINSDLEDDVMPPPESHLTLSAGEKALLEQWVREGAEYKPHWSLIPVHDSVPAVPRRPRGPAAASNRRVRATRD